MSTEYGEMNQKGNTERQKNVSIKNREGNGQNALKSGITDRLIHRSN